MHATFVRSTRRPRAASSASTSTRPGRLPGVVDVVTGADVDLPPGAGHEQPGDGPPSWRHRPGALRRRAGGRRAERDARGRVPTPPSGWWSTTTRCPPSSTRSPRSTATRCCSPSVGTNVVTDASATRAGPTRPAGRRAATSWSASASSTSAWPPCRSRGGRRPRPGSTAAWCCGARRRTPTACAHALAVDLRARRRPRSAWSPPTSAAASAPRSAATPRTSCSAGSPAAAGARCGGSRPAPRT